MPEITGIDRKLIKYTMDNAHIPGVSIAYKDYKTSTLSTTTIGRTDTRDTSIVREVQPDTIFGAASLSKPVFAYLVLKLIDKGILSRPGESVASGLDRPLHEVLSLKKFFHDNGKQLSEVDIERAKKITPRMLLSHTSGLGIDASAALSFAPGTEYAYSGTGLEYLQKVIEKQTGKSLEDLAQEHIFDESAMDMKHSSFVPPGGSKSDAANSLHTTASDYAKLMTAWIRDPSPIMQEAFVKQIRLTEDHQKLPKEKEPAAQYVPKKVKEHLAWGLGLGLELDEAGKVVKAFHTGDMNQFRAQMAIDLQKESCIVYFSNADNDLEANGHILGPLIITPKIPVNYAHSWFYSKFPFALNVDQLTEGSRFGLRVQGQDKKADSDAVMMALTPTHSQKSIIALEEVQRRTNIPGIAIAIISDKGVVTTQSVGVTNANNPSVVTDSTVFEAASLSKPVFAYIVLKLAQEGKINLDKPLHEYSDFGPPSMRAHENYKKLTACMILSHQAGLPNEFNPPTIPFDYVSPAGEKFDYSGEAYRFLDEVVEQVSSKSLETLAQNAFAKIGMTNTSFMPPTGCSLIRLRDEQEPTSKTIIKLLENELDKHGQLSIIYHKDQLFVAERAADGSVKITEKNSSQVDEGAFREMKERLASIPLFIWSKSIPIEARELALITTIVGHPPEHAATLAVGHYQDGSVNPSQHFYGVHPAGSLYTTASDYAKFLKACASDPYINEEMFKPTTYPDLPPTISSLKDKDTKAIDKGVVPEVLEQLSWGPGIGIQTNADGSRVAFHWGDNGTGRNLAAINLTTGKAIVCLTNSANGPAAFRTIAEPVVGDLSPISQWLSKREDLPVEEMVNPAQDIRQRLQELKPISTTDDAALEDQKYSSLSPFQTTLKPKLLGE